MEIFTNKQYIYAHSIVGNNIIGRKYNNTQF